MSPQQKSAEELRAAILRQLPEMSTQELEDLDHYLDSLGTNAGTATEQPTS